MSDNNAGERGGNENLEGNHGDSGRWNGDAVELEVCWILLQR